MCVIYDMVRHMPSEVTSERSQRTLLDVDKRGRVSLAKLGIKDTQLVAERLADGGVALHPAIVTTPAESRHYSNADAVDLLDRALAATKSGDIKADRLRSHE